MTDEQKTEWAEALRSGRYKQTSMRMADRDDNDGIVGHCCLMVALCTFKGDAIADDIERTECPYTALNEVANLNQSVNHFFAALNDEKKLTFEEIALVVENVPDSEWTSSVL